MNSKIDHPVLSCTSPLNKKVLVGIILFIAMNIFACKSNDRLSEQRNPALDSLKTVNDSLVAQYNTSNLRIDELITKASHLDTALFLKNNEVSKLQNEIASLKKKNKTLAAELKKQKSSTKPSRDNSEEESALAAQIRSIQAQKDDLSQQLADLWKKYNSLKELGSVLHASNIRLEALHIKHSGREKKTRRARKLDDLRIYFDIDENRIADDGTKKLYLVITGPDGKLLGDAGTITTSNGATMDYSVVKEVPLKQNEPVKDVTVNWQQDVERQRGNYNISIYNGGYKIGAGSVKLR